VIEVWTNVDKQRQLDEVAERMSGRDECCVSTSTCFVLACYFTLEQWKVPACVQHAHSFLAPSLHHTRALHTQTALTGIRTLPGERDGQYGSDVDAVPQLSRRSSADVSDCAVKQ
jgi:hypothetical protein